MSREKQTEEMADIIYSKINGANFDDVADAVVALYDAGYHKQSEGEWLSKHHMSRSPRGRYTSYNTYTCSVCGNANGKRKTPFCPNCGAKMKERIEHEQERNAPGE